MAGPIFVVSAHSLQYDSRTVQASLAPEVFRMIGVEGIEWRNGNDSICGCPQSKWPW
jgi:hypothetical protein